MGKMDTALIRANDVRLQIINSTENIRRESLSQYLTPPETALLAVNMFSDCVAPKCLDLGAGTGILSVALYERFGSSMYVDAIDLDSKLLNICDVELTAIGANHSVIMGDAISVDNLSMYDKIILNPPYKKMGANDSRQEVLPVRSPNLYIAFLITAINHLKNKGECVAIIPRSWMNGQYFKSFRKWLFSNVSLDAIHIYGSRTEIFSDTDVLQEIMLAKVTKMSQSKIINVSESENKSQSPVVKQYAFDDLVDKNNDYIIRTKPRNAFAKKMQTLREAGFCASTGKIVDFRADEYIRDIPTESTVQLIYPQNFLKGVFTHPINGTKNQWFEATDKKSLNQLIGPGCTVVIKRFSSKEEKRRVTASFLKTESYVALENHLNYIHGGSPRKTVLLDELVAKGLTIWFNSTWIDECFRDISGSTQVNASDLNNMPVPATELLFKLGDLWEKNMTTKDIDEICEKVLSYGT